MRITGKTLHPDEYDMSLVNLANDLAGVLAEVFPGNSQSTSFILVGHSMVSRRMCTVPIC